MISRFTMNLRCAVIHDSRLFSFGHKNANTKRQHLQMNCIQAQFILIFLFNSFFTQAISGEAQQFPVSFHKFTFNICTLNSNFAKRKASEPCGTISPLATGPKQSSTKFGWCGSLSLRSSNTVSKALSDCTFIISTNSELGAGAFLRYQNARAW